MTEPSDDDKKTAAALLPVCAHDHHGHPCGACLDVRTQIAAALAQAREEAQCAYRSELAAALDCHPAYVPEEIARLREIASEAITLDEARQREQRARAEGTAIATGELHDALAAAYAAIDPEEHPELSARLAKLLECTGEGACAAYQASMDAARESGRREERRACYVAVDAALKDVPDAAAQLLALDAIAARGPME